MAEQKAKAKEKSRARMEQADLADQGEAEFMAETDENLGGDFSTEEVRLKHFYDDYASERDYTFGKLKFLVVCQLVLLGLLGSEALTDADVQANFFMPSDSLQIIMCRFLCAVILHITLTDEIMQGFQCMKYAINHKYKFGGRWTDAYLIALTQCMVVIVVEIVNLAILCTNHTILDIIMNFLALVIIAEFDDYFFFTVDKTMMAEMISDGELKLFYGDEDHTRSLS